MTHETGDQIDIDQLDKNVRDGLRGMLGPARLRSEPQGFLLYEISDAAVASPENAPRNMWAKMKVGVVLNNDNDEARFDLRPEDEQLTDGSVIDDPDTVQDLLDRGILQRIDNIAFLTSTAEQQVIELEANEPLPDPGTATVGP